MSRKQLEIQLSQSITSFENPKIDLEQYQTPARVAANLLHIAWTRNDIAGKRVIDLCAGTGILGLGAALLDADVTVVEVDPDAIAILRQNLLNLDVDCEIIEQDVLKWEPARTFDTAVLNPPFGIQGASSDMEFVRKAAEIADEIYSIHDGSPTNQERLPDIFASEGLHIEEAYIDEFPLDRSYPWHTEDKKMYQVLIVHSNSS